MLCANLLQASGATFAGRTWHYAHLWYFYFKKWREKKDLFSFILANHTQLDFSQVLITQQLTFRSRILSILSKCMLLSYRIYYAYYFVKHDNKILILCRSINFCSFPVFKPSFFWSSTVWWLVALPIWKPFHPNVPPHGLMWIVTLIKFRFLNVFHPPNTPWYDRTMFIHHHK